MQGKGLMRIGDLSRKSGLSIRAIRYYEERGLLQPATRTEGNYRLYDPRALGILKTIQRLKMLGVGLSDIAELKGIYTREGDCTNLLRERFLQMIRERIEQIDRQIEELTLLREEMGAHYKLLTKFVAAQTSENLNRACGNSLNVGAEAIASALSKKVLREPPVVPVEARGDPRLLEQAQIKGLERGTPGRHSVRFFKKNPHLQGNRKGDR